ncbi:MAG: S8 family serine peptidase [Lachnospiraceae bacterium]|nr:S8 family serine peptidase [Lachnospiraceae bacterium]
MEEYMAKLSTELNLALNTNESERIKALDLNVGYDSFIGEWELIIKHTGSLEELSNSLGFSYMELLNGYAIVYIDEEKIYDLATANEILYIDKPKKLVAEENRIISGTSQSCMSFLFTEESTLSGVGVLVAIIDSGINYTHPVFMGKNGNSRIYEIWDQTVDGNPPIDYYRGTVYTSFDIDKSLEEGMPLETYDASGHGTAVASVVANLAPGAQLLIVKLANLGSDNFPTTSSLITGIDYAVRTAMKLNMPLTINLSYGNNYGAHNGNSILEDYINSVAGIYKLSIAVGTGNDGISKRHSQVYLGNTSLSQVDFNVGEFETGINLQIWKSYSDNIDVVLITPSGDEIGPFSQFQNIATYNLTNMIIKVIYSFPNPINTLQEIYISIIPKEQYIEEGNWRLYIRPRSISSGRVDIWLPVAGSTSSELEFLNPSEFTTLTIPSTATRAISVGAYNQRTLAYAPFSGRGYTVSGDIKPDIVAPGVDVEVAISGGGYGLASGTSFSTPFVSAAIAILMEYGIVLDNDPFLFGEKIKSYLIKGARKLPGYDIWPNEKLGWGALCLFDSFPN